MGIVQGTNSRAGLAVPGVEEHEVQRREAAVTHGGGEEGLAGGVGGEVQHGVGGLLSGQSQRCQGVHDQVEPQHLNCCQRGLLECDSPNACCAHSHNVDRQLQRTQTDLSA